MNKYGEGLSGEERRILEPAFLRKFTLF